MAGPREEYFPIVEPNTRVLAAFLLEGGRLIVNFSSDLKVGALNSASSEAMMIYGVVNTVTQPDLAGSDGQRVNSVQFLVEGEVQVDQFPGHFDLSEPVEPDPQWSVATSPARAENV